MSKYPKLIPVLVSVLITACSLSSTRIYSVSLPIENVTSDKDGQALITVTVDAEEHLKQPYIVHRKSPYQFTIKKYSKWEVSPRKIVREGFRNALFLTGTFRTVKAASINPRGFYLLKVNLKRFERLREQDYLYGLIEMDVKLWSPGGEELYFKTVIRKERLADKDFSLLAKSLSGSLEQVIDEIRTDVIHAVENKGDASVIYK
jgi:uncharacterized lipoprotein YmbA